MTVNQFVCPNVTVSELTAINVVNTKETHTVTISNSDSVNQALWTVVLIKDDDTYIMNPTAGTYFRIAAIQINGVAYNISGSAPVYYTVTGANSYEYFDGSASSVTTRYHLDLTQNTTIEFHEYQEPIVSYSVQIINSGFANYPSYWTVVLTKSDNTTVTANAFTTYTDIVSMQITGLAYQHPGDGAAAHCRITGADNTLYFDGSSSPETTTYNLNLTQNTNIVMIFSAGCFSKNMMVRMADGTDKPIGQVRSGDMVKAYNCEHNKDNEELVNSEVRFSSAGLYQTEPKYEKYTFSNGTVIEIVNRDRLYNVEENKMKWTDEWAIGEHALTYDGQEVALVSHETIHKEIEFHVFADDYYNYFINGLLAGQKMARYPFFPSKGFGTSSITMN